MIARRVLAWLGVLLAGGVSASGCLSEHLATEPATGITCARADLPPGPDSAIVVIRAFQYTPAELTVAPGTRIVWVNCEPEGTAGHTTTADEGLWDSPTLVRGDVYSIPAPDAGSFGYHCRPHPGIRGTVTIQAAGVATRRIQPRMANR